jgi:hypothetical protein
MRGSEFTQSIAQLCTLFKKEEVEETPRTNKKRGKKIEKPAKLPRHLKKDDNATMMSASTNLNYSQPRRE